MTSTSVTEKNLQCTIRDISDSYNYDSYKIKSTLLCFALNYDCKENNTEYLLTVYTINMPMAIATQKALVPVRTPELNRVGHS